MYIYICKYDFTYIMITICTDIGSMMKGTLSDWKREKMGRTTFIYLFMNIYIYMYVYMYVQL